MDQRTSLSSLPGLTRQSINRVDSSLRWMRGSSPRMTSNFLLLGPLRRLGEFLDDAVALELGQVIDEQHAVEVVDLVLQAGGEQPVRLDLMRLAVEIREANLHERRPLDLLVQFGNRQAAFLVDVELLRAPDDLRIDHHLRVFR